MRKTPPGRATATPSPPPDNLAAARAAGLRYVSDLTPGITRLKSGRSFRYLSPQGKPVKDEETLRRIRALVIPPAWTEVWICPDPQGHIQATGRDARGRKQYRYHPKWRQVRDSNKYDKMIDFALALPRIRRRIDQDLMLPGLPREKVLATVVHLLENTLIRVGNDEYAKQNNSFGLTTMRDKHAEVDGHTVRFSFKGKSGVKHEIDLSDKRLAHIVKKCQDLPGYELFQYVDDDGNVRDIGSADVNDYLREVAGQEFTAKDFRTWAGTVLAAMALQEFHAFSTQRQAKKNVVAAVEAVARKLGNTTAVCRKCYIHPAILDSYLDGSLVHTLRQRIDNKLSRAGARPAAQRPASRSPALPPSEAAVLAVLQRRLTLGAKSGTHPRRKAG